MFVIIKFKNIYNFLHTLIQAKENPLVIMIEGIFDNWHVTITIVPSCMAWKFNANSSLLIL